MAIELGAFKQKAAAAKEAKEAQERAETERVQAEQEVKGHEGELIAKELGAAAKALGEVDALLGEYVAFPEKDLALLSTEDQEVFRAQFKEKQDLVMALHRKMEELQRRKEKIELKGDEDKTGTETQIKKHEPTPEDSMKALEELSFILVSSANSTEHEMGSDLSVEDIINDISKRTQHVKELQDTLMRFGWKGSNALSASEKSQLQKVLADAHGETYFISHRPENKGPYDEKSPTTLDNVNANIAYFMRIDLEERKEIRAEIAILKGEVTPNKVGSVNLVKMKEKVGRLTSEDKQGLIEKLQNELSRSEESSQKAEEFIKKNNEAAQRSQSALRRADRDLHNSLRDLLKLESELRKQFASVL